MNNNILKLAASVALILVLLQMALQIKPAQQNQQAPTAPTAGVSSEAGDLSLSDQINDNLRVEVDITVPRQWTVDRLQAEILPQEYNGKSIAIVQGGELLLTAKVPTSGGTYIVNMYASTRVPTLEELEGVVVFTIFIVETTTDRFTVSTTVTVNGVKYNGGGYVSVE